MNEPINVQVSATVERLNQLVLGTGDVIVSAGRQDADALIILQRRPDHIPNAIPNESLPLKPGDVLLRFKNLASLDVVIDALLHCRQYFETPTPEAPPQ